MIVIVMVIVWFCMSYHRGAADAQRFAHYLDVILFAFVRAFVRRYKRNSRYFTCRLSLSFNLRAQQQNLTEIDNEVAKRRIREVFREAERLADDR